MKKKILEILWMIACGMIMLSFLSILAVGCSGVVIEYPEAAVKYLMYSFLSLFGSFIFYGVLYILDK